MTFRLLALSIGASAIACSGAAQRPAPPRLLQPPRFDVDPVRRYRGEVIQQQTITANGQQLLEENLTISFVDEVAIAPRASGFAVTEQLSEVAVAGRLSAAEDDSTRRLLEGARVESVLGADLKMVSITAPSPEVNVIVGLLQTEPALLPLLPREPVARGASWTQTWTIELEGGSLLNTMRTTYEDDVPCGAATCARLVTVDTITPGEGVTGGGTARGTLLVDHRDGRLVSHERTAELDFEIQGTRFALRTTLRLRRE